MEAKSRDQLLAEISKAIDEHKSKGAALPLDSKPVHGSPLERVWTIVALFFWLLPLLWAFWVFYSPYTEPNPLEVLSCTNARNSVGLFVEAGLPSNAEVRVEQRGGFNLEVWVNKRDWESIPYPDRKGFTADAGKRWCEHPDIREKHVFLPSVKVRDLKNGADFASYSCLLASASIN
jgi:hypothetical protein